RIFFSKNSKSAGEKSPATAGTAFSQENRTTVEKRRLAGLIMVLPDGDSGRRGKLLHCSCKASLPVEDTLQIHKKGDSRQVPGINPRKRGALSPLRGDVSSNCNQGFRRMQAESECKSYRTKLLVPCRMKITQAASCTQPRYHFVLLIPENL